MITRAVRIGLALFFILASLSARAPRAVAQDIGVEFGMTQAGYGDALQRPMGIGGYVSFPINGRFAFRLAGSHHMENRSIRRSPCTGLVPPGRDCAPRQMSGDAAMTTFGAGLTFQPLPTSPAVQPEFYVLATATSVDVVFEEDGGEARLRPVTPDEPSFGIAVGGQVHYAITNLVALSGRVGINAPQFGACGADAWFPFCENRTLIEFGLGARLAVSQLFR